MPSRRELTFSEAEGLEPLPAPLNLGELPQRLRNALFNVLIVSILEDTDRDAFETKIGGSWREVLFQKHTKFDHRPVDEWDNDYDKARLAGC